MSGIYSTATLRDYLKIPFEFKHVFMRVFFGITVLAFFLLMLSTPVFESQVKVLISAEKQIQSPYYREFYRTRSSELALTQTEIIKSDPVLFRTVAALDLHNRPEDYEKKFASPLKKLFISASIGLENALEPLMKMLSSGDGTQRSPYQKTASKLRENILIEPVRDTNLITIFVYDYDPVMASRTANVIARSYLIYDLEQQLSELLLKYGDKHRSVQQLKDNINSIERFMTGEQLENIDAIGPASVKVIEQATVPFKPSGIPRKIIFVLVVFMAACVALFTTFLCHFLNQSVKTPDDVTSRLQAPYLGSIPVHAEKRFSGLKDIAENIDLAVTQNDVRHLLMAPVSSAVGSAHNCLDIIKELEKRSEGRILVINTYPAFELDTLVSLQEDKGDVFDLLEGEAKLEHTVHPVADGLDYIPYGRGTHGTIHEKTVAHILEQTANSYSLVVIISGPMAESRQSIMLARQVDGVVVELEYGRERLPVVQSALNDIRSHAKCFLGVYIANRQYPLPQALYVKM